MGETPQRLDDPEHWGSGCPLVGVWPRWHCRGTGIPQNFCLFKFCEKVFPNPGSFLRKVNLLDRIWWCYLPPGPLAPSRD